MTNDTQIHIDAGKPLQDFLANRPLTPCWQSEVRDSMTGEGDNANVITESVAINRLAERHEWLMSMHIPPLSDKTWLALYRVFHGWTEHTISEIVSIDLAGAILDDLGVSPPANDFIRYSNHMDEMEKLTGIELNRLSALCPVETLAVIESIERYWGRPRTDRTRDMTVRQP